MPDVTTKYLKEIANSTVRARTQLVEQSLPDHPVLFRKACLLGDMITYIAQCKEEPFDVNTFTLYHPNQHPCLLNVFGAADNARKGCLLLRDDNQPCNHPDHEESFKLAQSLFMHTAIDRIEHFFAKNTVPSVDVFRKTALGTFVKLDVRIERDWAALVREDVRWCLACPEGGRAALQKHLPQTTTVFQTLEAYQQVYFGAIAFTMAWDALAAGAIVEEEALPLPALDVP